MVSLYAERAWLIFEQNKSQIIRGFGVKCIVNRKKFFAIKAKVQRSAGKETRNQWYIRNRPAVTGTPGEFIWMSAKEDVDKICGQAFEWGKLNSATAGCEIAFRAQKNPLVKFCPKIEAGGFYS